MECPKCGAENRTGAESCSICGLPFTEVGEDVLTPEAATAAAANQAAAAQARDGGGANGRSADTTDPFFEARLEEREWYEKRRHRIEAAGGPEAYEARIQAQLAEARHRQHVRTVLIHGGLGVLAVVVLAVAAVNARGWAQLMASMPGTGVASGAQSVQTGGIGQAFGVAAALLVGAALLGSSAARIGRKALWGIIAALAVAGAEAAALLPFVTTGTGGPVSRGTGFGVAAFILATLVGGAAGAAFGGARASE